MLLFAGGLEKIGRSARKTFKGFLPVWVLISAVACLNLGVLPAFGQTDPASPVTQWVTVSFGDGNYPDPSSDQQTGSAESDIVGNRDEPSLYMQYASGWLGFRLRVGADASPAGFKGAAFVGLDADMNGSLDIFVGVNNQGSGDHIGIWNPGAGLNVSPKTTSIVSPALVSYPETSADYNFGPVTAINNPGVLSLDLNGDGKNDQFLTFYVPFAEVAKQLALDGITFATNSPMRLVAATATQDNSLNEDLDGANGGMGSSLTWQQLGAFSAVYSVISTAPVPEPSGFALLVVAGGLMLLLIVRSKSRRRGFRPDSDSHPPAESG